MQLVAETLTDGSLGGDREIYFTVVELAGNSAYDLLNSRKPISVLEDSFGVTQLAGAEEHHVRGRAEIMDLIERASSFRQTAPTLKNGASSRSHGICRIRVKNPAADTEGLLYLIDLAGSEAARDVAAHGADRMRETRDINMSLSVLKDCIRGKAMSDALKRAGGPRPKQKRPHIPFRQSALTKVLKHVFDPVGDQVCKTVVIACINPSLGDVGPSKNTLRYAEMLRVIVPKTGETRDVFTAPPPTIRMNTQARESGTTAVPPRLTGPLSSRDLAPNSWQMPFKKRVRPGMVVIWNPNPELCVSLGLAEDDVKLAAVLCPASVMTGAVQDAIRDVADGRGQPRTDFEDSLDGRAQYLCALVTPGPVAEAYELNLWRHTVIAVDDMEKEVILEYDPSARYYYVCS